MKLNLRTIIDRPGESLPFSFDLGLSDLHFDHMTRMDGPFKAQGVLKNVAGALELSGDMTVSMQCVCDRCMAPYRDERVIPVEAHLAESLQDEHNSEIFLLTGEEVDLDEIFTTAFVLSMDVKHICREDCAGLCPVCGADLNEEPCACKADVDSRLAVLQQLLNQDGNAPGQK